MPPGLGYKGEREFQGKRSRIPSRENINKAMKKGVCELNPGQSSLQEARIHGREL